MKQISAERGLAFVLRLPTTFKFVDFFYFKPVFFTLFYLFFETYVTELVSKSKDTFASVYFSKEKRGRRVRREL